MQCNSESSFFNCKQPLYLMKYKWNELDDKECWVILANAIIEVAA